MKAVNPALTSGFVLADDDGEPFWFLNTLTITKVGAGHSQGQLSIVDHRMPPGFAPPPHIHQQTDEALLVLHGQLQGFCGDSGWNAGPGSLVFLPRAIPHGFTVSDTGPGRIIIVATPGGFDQFAAAAGTPARTCDCPTRSRPTRPTSASSLPPTASSYCPASLPPPLRMPEGHPLSTDQPVTELVTRARNGDEQAWDALVARYAPLIWSICRQHRLEGADAADVGQSVWLHLVDHLDRLRDPAALPGWLATTTRRECGRALCTARGPQAAGYLLDLETLPDQQAATAEQELLTAERHAALRQAVLELPPDSHRLLALLTADPPVPYAEISARLGIPAGSIGPTRCRCLDKLRRSPAIAALINTEDSRVARDGPSHTGSAAVSEAARASPGAQSPARRYRSLNVRYRTYRARHVRTIHPLQRHHHGRVRGRPRFQTRPPLQRQPARRHDAGPPAASARTQPTPSSVWSPSMRQAGTPSRAGTASIRCMTEHGRQRR
jgi:RNA polymerase sigma factor (sigma-70 family)